MKVIKDNSGVYLIDCIGCKCYHGIWVDSQNSITGAVWTFNGNYRSPTFSPSLNIQYKDVAGNVVRVCHSIITDGKIFYCADSTHEYAGTTQELADIDADSDLVHQ